MTEMILNNRKNGMRMLLLLLLGILGGLGLFILGMTLGGFGVVPGILGLVLTFVCVFMLA